MIVISFLLWSAPGLLTRDFLVSASETGSRVLNTSINYFNHEIVSFTSLFRSTQSQARPQTVADRTAEVSSIAVSPYRLVGYIGDAVTFVAMGTDVHDRAAHGAKFTWESSDNSKLVIDDAGRAALLRPGMVRVTARAAGAEKSVSVLIRPTRRRVQTDEQWRVDQDSLVANSEGTSAGSVVSSIIDRLAPAVYAQFNLWGDNPNAAGQVGTPPFTALEGTRLGPVMPGSNFELPMPLVNLGGRGLATSLMLYYNSSVWGTYFDPVRDTNVYAFDPIQSWPSPGFSLGFGRITFTSAGSGYRYMLIDPNGTRHDLGVGSDSGTNTLQTTDGTHITYAGNALGGTLYFNDGTAVTIGKVNNRLLPTQITDTNGNYIQIAYHWETNFPPMAINYIVDTLGRVIQFHYDAYNSTNLTSITMPTGTVSLGYQTVTMNPNFLLDNPIENMPASFSSISSVTIPARPTCQFTYSGYGMIRNIVATSEGGTASVTYDYPQGGDQVLWPAFTHRTEQTGSQIAVYIYGSDGITRPDQTRLILSGPDRELRSSTNTMLSKTVSTLTTDSGGSTVLQSVIAYDDATPQNQTKTAFDYDQYGNVVNQREYGYQIGGQWQVRRRTHYSYVNWEPYLSAYVRNRVTETDVYDALQNNNDADDVLVAKAAVGYDSYATMGGMESYGGTAAPPGHLAGYDTSHTTRANVTAVTTYTDVVSGTSVTRNSKLDIFGNVVKAQVSCCNEKTFSCDGHTYWARPCAETSGNPSGTCLTTSRTYDFNTLTVTSVTDPNGQTASYGYDAAQRLANFTAPTGANGTIVYNALGEKTSSTTNFSEGGVNKSNSTSAVYDGWGQMTSSIDANGAQTNYTYYPMGQLFTKTNPFPQGGTPGPVTTYHYDELGRPTVTTLQDGNTITTAYSGANIVQTTDQVNRQTKRESDSLGRLIKVTEQDVSTGALTQETTYTYDIADHLIGVNQGNQTRAFKYDSQGRLLFERIPEMTATINDGTGTYWTTKYTYTDFGPVATKTDARGVVITYGYDTLNRLTSITYNASGATGVDSTNNVAYNYDTSQTSETNGLLLSITMTGPMATYTETLSYDDSKRVSSRTWTRDNLSYTTSYQYNTANQLTQMTYPVTGRTLNVAHDHAGRVSSLADQYRTYANNFMFNPSGQVTGLSLGNVATETYGYDTNRMQLISQTATQNGGSTNGLMNLHYYYDAAAGQMGAGSTAGNAGQLMAINSSSTINGTAESAAYTYDDLGRLVTSNQTSNGSSAQRRFAYDRWGNRTGMWDATSGGTQLQSIALQQSGGVPTNQIASITASGATKNYTYDANGNLINDGVHVYTYDGENRLRTVDWGTANQAAYVYDYANRRIKKYANAAITYYAWAGNQVIGEYDSTGAAVYNYVYSGSRLIARMGSGLINWYLRDRLSERLVLDVSGNVIGRMAHLPFGEDFGESGTQEKHHFASYEGDGESGTDYAVNRQYSQNTGRFNRPDPLPLSSKKAVPHSWNRFGYAVGDPINLIDPLGLDDNPLGPDWDAPCGLIGYIPIEDGWGSAFTSASGSSIECNGPERRLGLDPGDKRDDPPVLAEPGVRVPLTGERLTIYNSERTRLLELLGDKNSDCSKFLLSKLGLNGPRIARAVRAQRPFDGTLSTIGMVPAGLERSLGMHSDLTVQQFFNQSGAEAKQSEYAQAGYGATIFDVFYSPSGLYAGTILHETLHYFLGIGDAELASRLGVDISQQGSRAVSWAFRDAGCR